MANVKVAVLQRDTTELEGPEEISQVTDYVQAKGYKFQGSDNHGIDTSDNEITFTDPVNGTHKLSAVSKLNHRIIDELIHNICENSFYEITRVTGKVSTVIWWQSVSKLKKIREVIYSRTGNLMSSIVTKQYDTDGGLLETYTETISRTGSLINNITGVLS